MGHASFFCVAKMTCAHLTKSESPEHRGTPVLSKHISLKLPELTGSCTGNDILGPEMVKKVLFQCKTDAFDAILRQKASIIKRLLPFKVSLFNDNPKSIT